MGQNNSSDITNQTVETSEQADEAQTVVRSPSVGLQVLQLVVIPAVIVVACIGLAAMFGMLAGAKDNIDTHLLKLRQSSGAGKLALGLQDPRYKDRGLAAYNIATMIPRIETIEEKQRINDALLQILNDQVAPNEWMLRSYLLMALGQLGQAGGLEAIMQEMSSPYPQVRQGAIGGVLSWPDIEAAREALHPLLALLADDEPAVRTTASAAVGRLARAEDQNVVRLLRDAMESSIGLAMREVRWNAAVALAKLGDAGGSRMVANVLLDRPALSQMPAGESGQSVDQKLSVQMQDRIMLSAMASLGSTSDPTIWDKIEQIADSDPNRVVRNAAKQLVMGRSKSGDGS